MAVAGLLVLVRSDFRAVVNVADIGKLGLLSFLLPVGVAVAHLPAGLAALRKGRAVGHAEHVAHGVVGIGVVHYGASAGVNLQALQPAPLRLVGVERLRAVAVFHVRALPELVVAYAVHIVVSV